MENSQLKDEPSGQSGKSNLPSFHKRLVKLAKNMPQEERDKFPPDYSENLDHYLYGTPKKSP